jgi:outer membrane biosynthesis protein TonB
MSRAYEDGGIYNMKLSTLSLFCLLALFTVMTHADDGDFSDDPPATTPATDISAPPSSAGEFNGELTDAVGDEEPKVPQPDMEPSKPSVVNAAPEPPKKKEKKAAKKEKVGKKDKASKKEKAGKKEKASKKDKAGKKGKAAKKDKASKKNHSSKKDKAGKKGKPTSEPKTPPAM